MLEIRTGNKARCKLCEEWIHYGTERVVLELPSEAWFLSPRHYHLHCYRPFLPEIKLVVSSLEAFSAKPS